MSAREKSTQVRQSEHVREVTVDLDGMPVTMLWGSVDFVGCKGRFYVLIQIAEFTIGKSMIDFYTIRIRANYEQNALFQL